jgi:hypothetical protein
MKQIHTITTPSLIIILNAHCLSKKFYFGQSVGRMTKRRPANRTIFQMCPHLTEYNAIGILKQLILETILSRSCFRKSLIMLTMLVCWLISLFLLFSSLSVLRCLGVVLARVSETLGAYKNQTNSREGCCIERARDECNAEIATGPRSISFPPR